MQVELGKLFFFYSTEAIPVAGFDSTARYGAIVRYDEGGQRNYELISSSHEHVKADFSFCVPTQLTRESLAILPFVSGAKGSQT